MARKSRPHICDNDPQGHVQAGWEIDPIDRRAFLIALVRAAPEGTVLCIHHVTNWRAADRLNRIPARWIARSEPAGILKLFRGFPATHITINRETLDAVIGIIESTTIETEWFDTTLFKDDRIYLSAPDFMDSCTFVTGHTFDDAIRFLHQDGAIHADWFEPETQP